MDVFLKHLSQSCTNGYVEGESCLLRSYVVLGEMLKYRGYEEVSFMCKDHASLVQCMESDAVVAHHVGGRVQQADIRRSHEQAESVQCRHDALALIHFEEGPGLGAARRTGGDDTQSVGCLHIELHDCTRRLARDRPRIVRVIRKARGNARRHGGAAPSALIDGPPKGDGGDSLRVAGADGDGDRLVLLRRHGALSELGEGGAGVGERG